MYKGEREGDGCETFPPFNDFSWDGTDLKTNLRLEIFKTFQDFAIKLIKLNELSLASPTTFCK